VLGYLPTECPVARVYIDVAGLWSAVGSPELVPAIRRGNSLGELVAAFDGANLDFGRDVQDFALCATQPGQPEEPRGSVYVALGGALGGKQALDRYKAIIMALSHVDASAIIEERRSGIAYLVSKYRRKRVWIAMPTDDVLVFSTEDVAEIDALKDPHPVALERWQAQPGTAPAIGGFEYDAPGDGSTGTHVRGRLTTEGNMLVLDANANFASLAGLRPEKLEALRSAAISALDRSPLRALSGPVRDMTLSLVDGGIQAELRAAGPVLGQAAIQIASEPQTVRTLVADMVHAGGR
jgi:hypothetical protein